MRQSVADAFTAFSVPLEGRVLFMYLDVRSLVTTGIGNLIDGDDPEHFGSAARLTPSAYGLGWADKDTGAIVGQEEIDEEYVTVKFSGTAQLPIDQREQITTLRITDDAVDRMVRDRLLSNEATLRGRPEFANLAEWPADAQLGLLSMAWALGPAFRFPNFQAAAGRGDWLGAARESHISEAGNAGIRPRNVRNGLLFTIASWVAAPPAGDFSELAYDPSLSLADNMRYGPFPIPLNLDIGVQTALERLAVELGTAGYDPGGLDGAFGRGTRTALTNFQRDFGVEQTPDATGAGDVGRSTVAAIAGVFDERQIASWPPMNGV